MAIEANLYPYQEKGVQFAYEHGWTLLGDEQGLGKTVQAIALMDKCEAYGTLIVCPAMLKATWEHELEKFSPDSLNFVSIVSYDMFRKMKPIEGMDLIVFDEAHYLKNKDSKRTIAAWEWLSDEQYKPNHLLMLTGTPIKNHVTEFYSLIRILSECPHEGVNGKAFKGTYYQFANTFSNAMTEFKFGRSITTYEGVRNLKGLKALLHGKYMRRTADRVLDLPPIVRKKVYCKDKQTDKNLKLAWKGYSESGAFPTLKADCALAKAKFTAEYVEELLIEGPVVVYTDHRQSALAIHGVLGKKAGVIMGGTSDKVRRDLIAAYKAGRKRCLVMTIGAASTGLTLIEGNHLVFNDCPWVPADMMQAEKRIHRIGQTKTAFIHFILSGEVDEMIMGTILKKTKHIGEVHGSVS